MENTKYFYVKDFNYLKPKKTFRKDLVLIALGLIVGFFLTKNSYTSSSSKIISPLSAQTKDETTILPTLTPIIHEVTQTLIPTSTVTPAIELTPTMSPAVNTKKHKNNYTIALLGDSMFDTAGIGYPQLVAKLKSLFPEINFNILNYGVGARDLEYGLYRLTNDYEYLGENIPSLLSQNLDIIIIESFAYNHWSKSQSDLDREWLTLAKIVDEVKSKSAAKIVFLATIAPNREVYGKGIKDINWTEEERKENSETVKMYLQNHINFANSQKIPLIDIYHQTMDSNGEGKIEYINHDDFLHPSPEGHELVASEIAKWLTENL